jgi:hypothetical protein
MSLGKFLQLVGGICEFVGLLTVAVGISETRRAFTNRAALPARMWQRIVAWLAALFRRKKTVTLKVSAGAVSMMGARVRLKMNIGWEGLGDAERLERLKGAVDRHEDLIADLDERLDTEAEERATRDEQQQRERD